MVGNGGFLYGTQYGFTHSIELAYTRSIEMPGRLKVLSVGSGKLAKLVSETLLPYQPSCHSVAENYWDLCSHSLREEEKVSIAVLELASSGQELQRSAEHIRRRWPDAGILLVGDRVDGLHEWSYDERVPSAIAREDLLAAIHRLLAGKQRARRGPASIASKLNGGDRRCIGVDW
jgi:hypothetical protein